MCVCDYVLPSSPADTAQGIIYIKGMAARFVFQGVHMLFDGQPGTPWEADERRCSKLVYAPSPRVSSHVA